MKKSRLSGWTASAVGDEPWTVFVYEVRPCNLMRRGELGRSGPSRPLLLLAESQERSRTVRVASFARAGTRSARSPVRIFRSLYTPFRDSFSTCFESLRRPIADGNASVSRNWAYSRIIGRWIRRTTRSVRGFGLANRGGYSRNGTVFPLPPGSLCRTLNAVWSG